MIGYCQLEPWEKNFSEILIKMQSIWNSSEIIVYEMVAILSRGELKENFPKIHLPMDDLTDLSH